MTPATVATSSPLRTLPHPLRPYRLAPHLAVAVLAAFLFFDRLGERELWSSHEARAAQNAQRMLDDRSFALPVLFDGQTDLQKPPGFYWLVAACGWANGGHVDALAVRLPPAVAGWLTVLMVMGWLTRAGRPTAAAVAGLTLATAAHFTGMARTGRIDVPLTAAVAGAVLLFARGAEPGARRVGWWAAGAMAAVAALLKGPVGFALIGATCGAWRAVEAVNDGRRLRTVFEWRLLVPFVVAVGLAVPWFVWAERVTGGEFARVFVWHHNVERFLGTSATLATHPWWYYGVRFLADALPWSPLVVAAIVWAVRSGAWRVDAGVRLGLVWFAAMAVVLSAAKFKRADYLLPAYPGAALLLGCAAEAYWQRLRSPRARRRATVGVGVLVVGVLVGWQVQTRVIEPREGARQEKRAFAAVVRGLAPRPGEVILFRAESHLLAYHLGRPVRTLIEWADLQAALAVPGPHVVVMPPDQLAEGEHVLPRKLAPVARLADHTPAPPPRPLTVYRAD